MQFVSESIMLNPPLVKQGYSSVKRGKRKELGWDGGDSN